MKTILNPFAGRATLPVLLCAISWLGAAAHANNNAPSVENIPALAVNPARLPANGDNEIFRCGACPVSVNAEAIAARNRSGSISEERRRASRTTNRTKERETWQALSPEERREHIVNGTRPAYGGRPVKKAPAAEKLQASGVTLLVSSPDGVLFAEGGQDGRIKIGRAADGATLHTFFHCNPTALEFSWDGNRLWVTGGQGKTPEIRGWRLSDGQRIDRDFLAKQASDLIGIASSGRRLYQ